MNLKNLTTKKPGLDCWAEIANAESKKVILEILDRETGEQARYRLVEQMTIRYLDFDYDFDKNLQLLEELKLGTLDMPKKEEFD